MPGTYPANNSTIANGVVSVRNMENTPSYQTIQSSFGSSMYKLENLYYKANSVAQLQQQLLFTRYNSNGNIEKEVLPVAVDPYQFQNILNVDTTHKNFVFDGQLTYFLPLEVFETCYMFFTVRELNVRDFLPKDNMFSRNDFFRGFKNQLDE